MSLRKTALVALGLVALSLPLAGVFAMPARADSGYQLVPLAPIADRTLFYGGSVLPVQFMILDSSGNAVTTATATIWVNGAPGTSVGHLKTDGNNFRLDGVVYIYNLNTKPLPAGPGSPTSTVTIDAMVGTTTLTASFTFNLH